MYYVHVFSSCLNLLNLFSNGKVGQSAFNLPPSMVVSSLVLTILSLCYMLLQVNTLYYALFHLALTRVCVCVFLPQGSRVALRNLHSKQHKVDEEALKQQELLYMQDLQLQQLEHKYNRMEGERTDDELVALNNKIKVSQIMQYTTLNIIVIIVHCLLSVCTWYMCMYVRACMKS